MTLIPRWWPRGAPPPNFTTHDRTFQVTPETKLLTKCHWQPSPQRAPTVLMIHGLEGCTESHYMIGLAYKVWKKGWNCIRINQRNCGDSAHLTPTLYHNGLSQDYQKIIQELTQQNGCQHIWLIGYSMGGNLALKLAGEIQHTLPSLRGVAVVSPNIHPASCVRALQKPTNWVYHEYFLRSLKAKLTHKNQLFPGKWDLEKLPAIQTMWEFDDVYTAPDGGFQNANDYYNQTGAQQSLHSIQTSTLIITAQDDPFIPFNMFNHSSLNENPLIQLEAPTHGGHCGFFQTRQSSEDPFWAENRIVDWIHEQIIHEPARHDLQEETS